MRYFMHINAKGQVTIPLEIREKFGFLPNSEVEFIEENQNIILVKKPSHRRGAAIIKALRGKGDIKLTTDQIMKLTRG